MTACLLADSGAISLLPETAPDSCTGYILMTGSEYKTNLNPFAEFDYTLAGKILGFELCLFILGFSAGFICRKLGR